MEQTRVDGGIWMPERVEVRVAARIFFVKSLVIDRILTYSKYTLAEAGNEDPSFGSAIRRGYFILSAGSSVF